MGVVLDSAVPEPEEGAPEPVLGAASTGPDSLERGVFHVTTLTVIIMLTFGMSVALADFMAVSEFAVLANQAATEIRPLLGGIETIYLLLDAAQL